jgi:hypothetical protein
LVQDLWPLTLRNRKNRTRFFDRKIEGAGSKAPEDYDAWILRFNWKSIKAFVDNVFDDGVSPNRDYPLPKRNLILHGKSDPAQWGRADCLRLFQAICEIGRFGES